MTAQRIGYQPRRSSAPKLGAHRFVHALFRLMHRRHEVDPFDPLAGMVGLGAAARLSDKVLYRWQQGRGTVDVADFDAAARPLGYRLALVPINANIPGELGKL